MIFASVKLFDPDGWWHLATGKWMLAHGLPSSNTFSFTHPEFPWRHAEWLFDLVLALADRAAGLAGVEAVQVALVAAAFAVSADTVRRDGGGRVPPAYYPTVLLALAISWHRCTPRPHLVTWVGLALLLNLSRRPQRHPLLWHTLLAATWANCHAGVVFGSALVVAAPFARLLSRDRAAALDSAKSAAAFLAGSLVTPHPGRPYEDAVFHLGVRDILKLAEFRPVNPRIETAFVLFAAVAVVAALFHLSRRRFAHPVLVAVFLPVALCAVRIMPEFTIVALPGTVAALDALDLRLRRSAVPGVRAALLLLLAAGAWFGVDRERHGVFPPSEFGWGVATKTLPEGACRFIEAAGLRGGMYNDFALGGYLIWRFFPERRVFQDGRVPVYPSAFLRGIREAFRERDERAWGALMDRHRVEYAVVDRMPFGNGLDAGMKFSRLGWTLVYLDGPTFVYLRPGALNREAERRYGMTHLGYRESPEDLYLVGRAFPAAVGAEVGRIDPEGLLLAEDFVRFGVAALGARDDALAQRFLDAGMREHPRDAGLKRLAAVLRDRGR